MEFSTLHKIVNGSSKSLHNISSGSVQLVVTSPPYPMIEMWDEIFSSQNNDIQQALLNNEGEKAFELMHQELDEVWKELYRALAPGGFACINIGDAVRTLNGNFKQFSNHSRIITAFIKIGFTSLPNIIWRKQTNAPNKFMGSGMLPAGAFVTLEHEWILIFRKGEKQKFDTAEEKEKRRQSAFFWEERNIWFSDVWELKGKKQAIENSDTRTRSAAYPIDIPFRLINMYSLTGDTVLDPFAGTGTTTLAAIASGRNSLGYEIDPRFVPIIHRTISTESPDHLNLLNLARIERHQALIAERELKYNNNYYNLPVMTAHETSLRLPFITRLECTLPTEFEAHHSLALPVKPVSAISSKTPI